MKCALCGKEHHGYWLSDHGTWLLALLFGGAFILIMLLGGGR